MAILLSKAHEGVVSMRVNRTYSLDFQTIAELNNTISAKHRSKFVDKAIKHRLNGCESSQGDIDTKRLMALLHAREEISEQLALLLELEMKS
jgi:hypothetical protein